MRFEPKPHHPWGAAEVYKAIGPFPPVGRQAYDLVKDIISREEFDRRVRARVEEWEGLLEDDVAALLVVDELGRSQVAFSTLAEVGEDLPVRVRVRVEEVGQVKEFSRAGGRRGRVVNLTISDASSRCRLVLWDDDVELVAPLSPGALLELIDCEARRGPFGLEILRGRWGTMRTLGTGR